MASTSQETVVWLFEWLNSFKAAILKIPLQDGIPQDLEFPLVNGRNKIGRSETCEVCISSKVLSKQHAVIEIGFDCFAIYDLNSCNKSWRGKRRLKPYVRYKLDGNQQIKFGHIKAQFIVKKQEVDDGEGLETGCESMLLNEEWRAVVVSTPKSSGMNEHPSNPSENASSFDELCSKSQSGGETKDAPTCQLFHGGNLSDSDDETDCEDHSVEKGSHRAPDLGSGGETSSKEWSTITNGSSVLKSMASKTITVQKGQSGAVENWRSGDKDEDIGLGDDSLFLGAIASLNKCSVPVHRLPLTPQQHSRIKVQTPGGADSGEMQSDLLNETLMISSSHTSGTEKEAGESALSERRACPEEKRISRLTQSRRKEVLHANSRDASFSVTVSSDSSVKMDEETAFTGLKKNCHKKSLAPRSRRLRKKEEVPHSNPTEPSLSSAILDSSTRSLRLSLSTSETSADERPNASQKCQIAEKNKKAKNSKNKVAFTSPSLCRKDPRRKPRVMFTMVEDEEHRKVVMDLGGKVVKDINLCTHLVADELRRTVEAMCCIAKGIPIVNTKWIQRCKKSESFVDHIPYLLKDKEAERHYRFNLLKTLQKSSEKPLLSSWSVHVTPKVVPSPKQMRDIIQCAGGKYLPKMPNRPSDKTVIISCAPDLDLCRHAAKRGIPVMGSEFILTGILQYKIDTKLYMLHQKLGCLR